MINKQLESLRDLIDEYTELLDAEKDAYDYQKELKEQQEEISKYEKQLAAYAGDNSEEGMLKRQQLQNDLKESREELQEKQYNRYISDTKELLNNLYDDYEEVLNRRLDDIDALVAQVVTQVNTKSDEIKTTLETEARSVGYDMTKEMKTIWSNEGGLNSIFSNYSDMFENRSVLILKYLDSIRSVVAERYGVKVPNIGGYKSGTKSVDKNGLYWTNEDTPETIVRKSDGAILTKLNVGDMVLPTAARNNFWNMMSNPDEFFSRIGSGMNAVQSNSLETNNDITLNMSINLPNVQNYEQFKTALKNDANFEKFV